MERKKLEKPTDKGMQANPGEKDKWYSQNFGRGRGTFEGRITPKGARAFYFRFKGPVTQERVLIGPYHPKGDGEATFTTGQAREKAISLSTLYRTNNDLKTYLDTTRRQEEEKKELEIKRQQLENEQREAAARLLEEKLKRRITLENLFEDWRATDLQPVEQADGRRTGRKDGGKYVYEQFKRHVFPALGPVAVEDIKKADILNIIDHQKTQGKQRTAQVLYSELNQLLDFAQDRDIIPFNPMASLKKRRIVGTAKERDRYLSDEELSLLAKMIPEAKLSLHLEAGIWISLSTGTRIGELVGAAWSDSIPSSGIEGQRFKQALKGKIKETNVFLGIVDLDKRTWYLDDSKNQRDHLIHLSDFAIEQFSKMKEIRSVLQNGNGELSPWVFPSTNNNFPISSKAFQKQVSDRQRGGEPLKGRSKQSQSLMIGDKWTMHDLRRTATTSMVNLGISKDVANQCTNHIDGSKMDRVYIQTRLLEKQREAFDVLSKHLYSITNPN